MEDQSDLDRAPRACLNCTKQKRKCDKVLPECSLCKRNGRTCEYAERQDRQDELSAIKERLSELEEQVRSPSNGEPSCLKSTSTTNTTLHGIEQCRERDATGFPSLFFLDSTAFAYQRRMYRKPRIPAPERILEELGTSSDVQRTLDAYFAGVHSWLPIVSRMRLFQYMSQPQPGRPADLGLLFLCMKLVMEPPNEHEQPSEHHLYQLTKSYLDWVESHNVFSIQVIQSAILLACYEIGHSIYPKAYLSVGHVVTMGHAMGLHDRKYALQMLRPAVTITEQEERRRVWWGVLTLERYVNLGNRNHPLMSEEPGLEERLPVDETSWDTGRHTINDAVAINTAIDVQAAPFARTCQAAHLMGRVIRHLNDKKFGLAYRFDEALQLSRTLKAFSTALPREASCEGQSLWVARALTCSALIALYDAYSCTETDPEAMSASHIEMQRDAIRGLRDTTAEMIVFVNSLAEFVSRAGLESVGPLVLDSVYCAGATLVYYHRENGNPEASQSLEQVKSLLEIFKSRWALAKVYLEEIDSDQQILVTVD